MRCYHGNFCLHQNAIAASPSSANAVVKQLQSELQEKEKVLQEIITEHGHVTDKHDKTVQDLLNKLKQKDNQNKVCDWLTCNILWIIMLLASEMYPSMSLNIFKF